MDQKTIGILMAIAGELDKDAKHFKAAKIWLERHHSNGFAACAKREAMERWQYYGKIVCHINERGGIIKVLPSTQAVPCDGEGWTVNGVFKMLVEYDSGVLQAMDNAISELSAMDNHPCLHFVVDLQENFWKDVSEVKKVADHTGSCVPPGLLTINLELEKLYA